MWWHMLLWLCVASAFVSFFFDVALPSGGSPGALAPPDRLVMLLAAICFSPVATWLLPVGPVALAACLLSVVAGLWMRLHWRSLNAWTGATVALQWEERAFPALGRLYAAYRRRWDPALFGRG
jgi:hypothetical protein